MEIPRNWRVRTERYSLQTKASPYRGIPSFPPRPIPVDSSESERHTVIADIGARLKKEVLVYTADMYYDQLEDGMISPLQYKTSIKNLIMRS